MTQPRAVVPLAITVEPLLISTVSPLILAPHPVTQIVVVQPPQQHGLDPPPIPPKENALFISYRNRRR
jgi:hypothetical protein